MGDESLMTYKGKRSTYGVWLASILMLSACATAPSSQRGSDDPSAPNTATLGELIVAALRASQVERKPPLAFSYAERALAQEPKSPELVWLTLRLCADVPRCKPQTYEARLRKLDPDNAAVWMGPLTRARVDRDLAVHREVLQALSRGKQFDVYWNPLLWRAALALRDQSSEPAPKTLNGPLTKAINEAAAWMSAVIVPSFTPLADACSDERMREDVELAELCRRIARVLQQGDTYAAEAVGVGIAQRAVPLNSVSSIALAERAATLSYQHETARSVMSAQLEREKVSAELIELMKKLRREQDVSLAVLRWAKQPLVPLR